MRPATFSDHGQISALERRQGLSSTRSPEDWSALWNGNPAYERRRRDWPIGWVLETAEGEIVGSIGNIPLEYDFKGRRLTAATGIGWVVDSGYRGYSLLLMAKYMSQNLDLMVSTTVGNNAEPILRALGWEQIPWGRWNECGFWITDRFGFAESVLAAKSARLPFLRHALSAALLCRETVARHVELYDEFTIELRAGFDDRFDAFWEELKQQEPNRLLAVRTREMLAWHYRFASSRNSLWIVCASKGPKLVAYAVFDKFDRQDIGMKRMRLVDCQALSGFEAAAQSIIAWSLEKCRQANIHALENHGCWLRRLCPEIRFPYRRRLRSWTHYYNAKGTALVDELKDAARWAPSSFDGDASL